MTELESFKPKEVKEFVHDNWRGILVGAVIKIFIFAAFAAWGITHYIQSKIPAYEIIGREALVCGTYSCTDATTSQLTHLVGYLIFIPVGIFVYNNYIKKIKRK